MPEPRGMDRLTGCDALLLGSIQIADTAAGSERLVRITTRVVSVAGGVFIDRGSIVLDGTLATLFEMETTLAERLAAALGCPIPALGTQRREEQSLDVQRLFAEGLLRLAAGTELLAACIENDTASSVDTPEQLSGAASEFEAAVARFRDAQMANAGFFGRAHSCEARARECLALAQAEETKMRAIREATVAQFRKDAADAAPAFYDLGRALEACEQYSDAAEAYRNYLAWIDESQKTVVFDLHQDLSLQTNGLFVLDGQRVLIPVEGGAVLVDAPTGKILSRYRLPHPKDELCSLGVGPSVVALLARQTSAIHLYDLRDGTFVRTLPITEPEFVIPRFEFPQFARESTGPLRRVYFTEDESLLVCAYGKDTEMHVWAFRTVDGATVRNGASHVSSRVEALQEALPSPLYGTVSLEEIVRGYVQWGSIETAQVGDTKDLIQTATERHMPTGWYWVFDPKTHALEMRRQDDKDTLMWRSINPQLAHVALGLVSGACSYIMDERDGHRYVLCVRASSNQVSLAQQAMAFRQLGRCCAKLKDFKGAEMAFVNAEGIDSSDTSMYWEWVGYLPETPQYAKRRFRLYEWYWRVAPDSVPEKAEALERMRHLAGVRAIMPGYPHYGWIQGFSGPNYLMFDFRDDRQAKTCRMGVRAYDPLTGALRWERTRDEPSRVVNRISHEAALKIESSFAIPSDTCRTLVMLDRTMATDFSGRTTRLSAKVIDMVDGSIRREFDVPVPELEDRLRGIIPMVEQFYHRGGVITNWSFIRGHGMRSSYLNTDAGLFLRNACRLECHSLVDSRVAWSTGILPDKKGNMRAFIQNGMLFYFSVPDPQLGVIQLGRIDCADGRILWSHEVGMFEKTLKIGTEGYLDRCSAMVVDDILYVGGVGVGMIFRYRVATGEALPPWSSVDCFLEGFFLNYRGEPAIGYFPPEREIESWWKKMVKNRPTLSFAAIQADGTLGPGREQFNPKDCRPYNPNKKAVPEWVEFKVIGPIGTEEPFGLILDQACRLALYDAHKKDYGSRFSLFLHDTRNFIWSSYYDAGRDAILLTDSTHLRTYAFDRKKLIELVRSPGE